MMSAEFDSSMGFSKHDKTSEKNNYRNDSTKKKLKSEFLILKHLEIEMVNLNLKIKEMYQE